MNFNQIKYFVEICKYGSVSEASKTLSVSQPSLSNSIKELEREFGVSLFKRHHKGMSLTPEGEKFLEMAKDILERAYRAENIMSDIGRERKKLRLGVPPMIGSLILSKIYGEFVCMHKDIEVEIIEGGSNDLLKKLSDNYIDMAFLPHKNPFENKFNWQTVARLEIECCVSLNNPLSNLKCISPYELSNEPLVLLENSYFQTEEIKKWFEFEGITPNILLQTSQLSTMLYLISDNIATGFMFGDLASKHSYVKRIPLSNALLVDVSLVYKKHNYSIVAMQKFKEYINKCGYSLLKDF